MTTFVPDPRRAASPTIRGFVYQTNLTIQRWLALRENETLELESGEDIDIVARGFATGEEEERIVEQVKDRTAPLTLRSAAAVESVANFALHRERNPNSRLRFRFTTTAPIGREQRAVFPSRQPGIVVWQRFRDREGREAEHAEAANTLRTFYRGLQQPDGIGEDAWNALLRVVEKASDEHWLDFLTGFEWSTGSSPLAIVDAVIRSELVRLGLAPDNQIATTQHTILFVYVIRLLATNGTKRLTYPEIEMVLGGARDTTLETRVASLFERFEKRLNVIETQVADISLKQEVSAFTISFLVDRLPAGERERLDAQVAAISQRFLTAEGISFVSGRGTAAIENIPPTSARVARRRHAVAALRGEVSAHAWTAVLGEPETGKTQLAVLVAQEWTDVQWFSSASLSSHEALTLRMRSIAGTADGNLLRAVVVAVPKGTLFVFDDLPSLHNDDARAGLLRNLATAAEDHIHVLSLSNVQAPRLIRDVLGDRFASLTIPSFSDEEARDLFRLYRAPPELPDRMVKFLNGFAHGNPTLLTALARYLDSRAWQIDAEEVQHLLSGAHLQETGRELMMRLRNDVQDAATRELFSRARLARRGLTLEDIRSLGEVDPAIDHFVERLQDLDGLWLRRESTERYTPTPLAKALPTGDLQRATERHCHVVLAEQIMGAGRLGRDAVMDVVYHFMQANEFNRAGSLLAAALAQIVQDEVWHEWLVAAVYTAAPLPTQMALHLRLYIRTQQLKIKRHQGEYPKHLLQEGRALVQEASPDDAALVASFVTEVAFEDTGDHEIWSVAMDALLRLTELRPDAERLAFMGQPLPDQIWGMLFYMVGRSVRTVADVDRWTEAADRLPEPRRHEVLATAFDRQSLVNAAWLRVAKRPRPPWTEVLAVHRRWLEWAERIGDDLLAGYAIRAEVIVRAEYLNESDDALAFANEMLARFEGAHERFILNETIATQQRRLGRYEEAERSYDAAFDDFDAATHTEQVYALHNAASAAGRRDPTRAVELLEHARDIVRNFVNEFDPVRLFIVSSDLGLAYWYSGRLADAFNEWDAVASMLIEGTSIEEEARHGLIGLLTKALEQISNILERTELDENERAVIGTFDRNVIALAQHWKPSQVGFLSAELTLIAAQVGRDDRAFVWIDRAVAIARTINEPVVTTFTALQALPWALARNDFSAALRFILALRGDRERELKAGDSELAQYVFLLAIQLCALMLTDPQSASDQLASIGASLREVTDEPDVAILTDLMITASHTDNTDQMTACIARTPPGTVVWAMAHLLRTSTSRQSTTRRAADHVTIAPYVVARASPWRDSYTKVVLTFFETFWQHELSVNAFRFRAPANVRRQLDQIHSLPSGQRLQTLLETVADAVDLSLPREFREWFRDART
jgi:tetratricopeptide (TPR) repeat protein